MLNYRRYLRRRWRWWSENGAETFAKHFAKWRLIAAMKGTMHQTMRLATM